jgi:DNA-binding CsgD family transcriptional regulator
VSQHRLGRQWISLALKPAPELVKLESDTLQRDGLILVPLRVPRGRDGRSIGEVVTAPLEPSSPVPGAVPGAERASTELRATRRTVMRDGRAEPTLTPQEIQVVRLVAKGGSNQEVAAQLFLSPRTVKYHLYKAYPKLGVSSRAELARLDLDSLTTE